jgi:hypothetical protein
MVEKMTAVWLIILTIIVCGAVPTLMIYLTAIPSSELLLYHYQSNDLPHFVINVDEYFMM